MIVHCIAQYINWQNYPNVHIYIVTKIYNVNTCTHTSLYMYSKSDWPPHTGHTSHWPPHTGLLTLATSHRPPHTGPSHRAHLTLAPSHRPHLTLGTPHTGPLTLGTPHTPPPVGVACQRLSGGHVSASSPADMRSQYER